jgi:superfamily II DNA/RNA helicase
MYNDLHLHYVRTKVVNRALMEVADPTIYEQIKSDIESKYGGFKSLEDVRRWIYDLPEYYKKFGNILESFIINVLASEHGIKKYCPSLEGDCKEVLEELGIGLDSVKIGVQDAVSGEALKECFLRVRGREYKFDEQCEIKVRIPSMIEVWREGYEVFSAEVTKPGDHIVKLSPCRIDVTVNVRDTLGSLAGALVRVSPAEFSGQAEEFLSDQNGSFTLKLLYNQLYTFEVFIGSELVFRDTVRVNQSLINLQVKDVLCRLQVAFRRKQEAQRKLFEECRPDLLEEKFKVVIYDYDEKGIEPLGVGFNGDIIPLTRPVKLGKKIDVRAYPLDRHGRYMPHLYRILKTFMEDQRERIRLVNGQLILIPIEIEEAEAMGEGLTLKFRDTRSYKSLKEQQIEIFEVELEGSTPKISEVSFGDYLEWGEDDKVKALFGGKGEVRRLYEHQHRALSELEGSGGRECVIVSSGMASGKTEIAVLYLLKVYKRDPDFGYAVIVYPTRELLRDQYGRWKRYFDAAYDLGYLNSPVGVAMYYGEIAKRPEGVRELEKIKARRCIILTTASTFCSRKFLSLLKRPPEVVVLDEVHFYRSFDLTILMEFLCFAMQMHGGFEKVIMFSATIGNADEFRDKVGQELGLDYASCCLIRGEPVRGRKIIYVVDLSRLDENHQEAFVDEVLQEYCRNSNDKSIVFARNRTEAEGYYYEKFLRKWGVKAALHIGDMSMIEREVAARRFKTGRCRWMVTVKTLEVGIDIGDVSRIIHIGLPPSFNEFMQREGRSGRQGQESESIVFARTGGDFGEAKYWTEKLKQKLEESELCKVIFNPRSFLATKIQSEIRKSGKWPEMVNIEGLAVKCKVFGGSRFKLVLPPGLEGKGEVYIQDVVFRYLPYSVRRRHLPSDLRRFYSGKLYVKEVNIDNKKVVLDYIEKNSKVSDLTKGKFYATTSQVETIIKVPLSLSPSFTGLDTVKASYRPLCVNYVHRDTRKISKDGKTVDVPRYYVAESLPVPDEVASGLEKLSVDFTRGFIIDFEVPKSLTSKVTEWIRQIVKEEGKKKLETEEEVKRVIKEVIWQIEGYLHLALHALINVVVQSERIHPREIEHYICREISYNEVFRSEIVRRFMADWGIDKVGLLVEELSPKLGIKIIVGNKTDLLGGINWRGDLEERLNELFEKADQETIQPFLELPDCFVIPQSVSSLFRDKEDFDKIKDLLHDLACEILGRIQNRADKLTVY